MTSVYPAVTSNGAVTSFVPLTTLFTPSAECSEYFRLNGPSLVAFDPGYGLDIDTAVRCVPSAVTTWWEQGRLGVKREVHTALSLGPLVCPYEWQTVATSVEDKSSTLAMCCPSGYYLANGIPGSVVGDCLSDVSAGMLLTYASTSADNSALWLTETTSLTGSSTVGAIAIVGWNIKLTNPTNTETTSSSATTPFKHASTSESISVPSSSPSPSSSSNNSSQISPGVAAGIGLGVGLGVIGTVSLLVTLCLMRRRKRRSLAAAPQDYGATPAQPPQQEPNEGTLVKHELDDQQTRRHELHEEFQNPQGQFQGTPPLAELHE
ncbi:hypothetical protein F4801DRAFT_582758 [Xylaria longipes]|nr:hypothetical protein F4801DRAFT_582758 [Xylaria longipes]RYC60103.1 hypothetical protein CHU98_g6107 [Xylaria longipes]